MKNCVPFTKLTIFVDVLDLQHDLQVDYYGKRLATCSSDRIIKIFDVGPDPGQQTLAANIAGHDGPVWQASLSMNDLVQFSGSKSCVSRLHGLIQSLEVFSRLVLMTER